MEALNFLKFWKPTIPFPTPVIELRDDAIFDEVRHEEEGDEEEEEEEDSFFDLEIASPPKFGTGSNGGGGKTPSAANLAYPKPSLIEPIPKRKVLPLEPPLKPQPSPIALLKSAPNFRAFSFKKSKPTDRARESARFSAAAESPIAAHSKPPERSASKDVIRKYLKLVKPLYARVSRRYANEKAGGGSLVFTASPSSSPAVFAASPKDRNVPPGIRVVCSHLGKSKSTTTTTSSSSLPSLNAAQTTSSSYRRRDDSLLQQHDGIESAILHCKRSFHSSRDSSLSRSTSDSSSIKSCSTESYRISHDNSATNSIEDGRSSIH